jgi:hypothetical protein
MQPLLQFFYLILGQLGAIASGSLIYQTLKGILSIGSTPFHQAGSATACDLFDLFFRVALSIQAYCLIACPRICIFALSIDLQ